MDDIKIIANALLSADAIIIGASNGLSISEGLHIFADNDDFESLFGDYKNKYKLQNILHGIAGRWPMEEEKWAFWSRLIHRYCNQYNVTSVMSDLRGIVGNTDYFVITSNGEGHFEQAGFAVDKVYEIEGNWTTMHCSKRCDNTLYETRQIAAQLVFAEENGEIPSHMIPHCPHCGAVMDISMAAGEPYMTEKEGKVNYQNFLKRYKGKRLVVLELGVGWRNQLIKAPLMNLVNDEPNAIYITINLGEIYIPNQIKNKSYYMDGDLTTQLHELKKHIDKFKNNACNSE